MARVITDKFCCVVKNKMMRNEAHELDGRLAKWPCRINGAIPNH